MMPAAAPVSSLATRFLRVVVPVLAVSIVVTTSLSLLVARRALADRTEDVATFRARAFADQLALEYESLRSLGLESVEFYRSQLIRYFLEAAHSDGAVAGEVGFETGDPPNLEPFVVLGDPNERGLPAGRYARAVAPVPQLAGSIVVYESVTRATAPLLNALVAASAILAVVFVLAVALVRTAVRRVSDPIRALAEQMLVFGAGTTPARIDLEDATEVGVLAREFNAMAERISVFTATLEDRVAIRTAELNASLDQLRRTQAQLVEAERLASLGSLLTGFAHELGTPLGVALSATDFVRQRIAPCDDPDDTRCRDTWDSAQLAVDNLRRAAEMLRRFQEVAVAPQVDGESVLDLLGFLEDVKGPLSRSLERSGAELVIAAAAGVRIRTFPGHLWNVLTAMIENATVHAFGESGPEHPRVRIGYVRDGDGHVILVSDNGNGVPESAVPRLFDPFFTTRRSAGAIGLGLHIAYSIVRIQLGGHLRYLRPAERDRFSDDAIEPDGACFAIVLPGEPGVEPGSRPDLADR